MTPQEQWMEERSPCHNAPIVSIPDAVTKRHVFWGCSKCFGICNPPASRPPEDWIHGSECDKSFTGKCTCGLDSFISTQLEAARREEREKKDNAYKERDQLVRALSTVFPSHLARHPDSDTTWEDDWRTIVCIHAPTGQMTWHIHDTEAGWFTHLKVEDNDWDGHTTEEKYRRLASLTNQIELARREERERVIEEVTTEMVQKAILKALREHLTNHN